MTYLSKASGIAAVTTENRKIVFQARILWQKHPEETDVALSGKVTECVGSSTILEKRLPTKHCPK